MSDERQTRHHAELQSTLSGCLIVVGVIIAAVFVCTNVFVPTPEEQAEERRQQRVETERRQQAAIATQQAEERAEELIEAAYRRQGNHCLESTVRNPRTLEELEELQEQRESVFDLALVEYVPLIEALEAHIKPHLPDPESMVIHDLLITPVDESGQHRALLDFGTRNEFGGMSRFHLVALVDSETCAPIDFLGIEEVA